MTAPTPADSLTFDYELTVADVRSALRARTRAVRSARLMKIVLPAAYAVFVAGVVAKGVEQRDWNPLVSFGLVIVMVLWGSPALQARNAHKTLEREGRTRTTVAAGGLAGTSANGSRSMTWSAFGRYTEAKDLFVLLSADKRAGCLVILPKRALTGPGDVDRLRALLDASLPRV